MDFYNMVHKKKISVIIPCYNAELTIDRCLESIVRQTIGIDSLEIILVNDASTDGTFIKFCEWEKRYPDSIIAINCKENGKAGTARNIGMKYASGLYIGFADADDVLNEYMYQILFEGVIEQCDLAICQSSRNIVCEVKKPSNRRIIEISSVQERQRFLTENYSWSPCNKIYLRDFLLENDIYFSERVYYEDIFFTELVRCYCKKIFVTDEPLYYYLINNNSTTRDVSDKIKRLDYIQVQIALIEELRQRSLYNAYEEFYANEFLINYLSFVTNYEKLFGEMEKEIEAIINENIIKLFPDFRNIPMYKSIMNSSDRSKEKYQQILGRLG